MSQAIHSFENAISDRAGVKYKARVDGEQEDDGTWTGWIVFQPMVGNIELRTGRETTQPDRDDLVYWASGLEPVYLEGALDRTR